MNLDNESIIRFLTLRYDPTKKPIKNKLISEDFTPEKFTNVESMILDIVKKNMLYEQDVFNHKKIAMSLSGGIDSGLTLMMLRKILPEVKITCVGMGFGNEDDEARRASEIARKYNCEFKEITKENILNELPKLITLVKEPKWNLYNYYTLEEGKKFSNVFYTGDGGDELFGGYTFRLKKNFTSITKNMNWETRVKIYLSCHERDWVPDQEKMFDSKMKFRWSKIYSLFKPYFNNKLSSFDQVFLADINGKLLYDWLPTNKKYEEFFKMELKSIFLSDDMIYMASHIPWQEKYDPKIDMGKLPLRHILSKEKVFEKELFSKKGFGTDLTKLWDKNAKDIVKQYVNIDSEIVKNKIINFEWIDKMGGKILNGEKIDVRYINKMISLLSLEIWYRLFITHTMKGTEKI